MNKLVPVSHSRFVKFLEHVGCKYLRESGNHKLYDRPDLKRPITIRRTNDIPVFHIKTNLKTLGITVKEFIRIMNLMK